MATHKLTPQLKPNLLNIPVEIRNEIYRMLHTTQYAFHSDRNGFGRLQTALLRVNRKIHTEAVDVLQGASTGIVAWINMSEQVRLIFDPYVPTVSQKVPYCIRHPALPIFLGVWNKSNHDGTPRRVSQY